MTAGQSKCVTKETRYHVSIVEPLKRNIQSQIAELVRRLTTMLKILSFSGGNNISKYHRGQNFSMTGGTKPSIYSSWRHNLRPGDNFSKFIDRGSHQGASHQGNWIGCSKHYSCAWYRFQYLFCIRKSSTPTVILNICEVWLQLFLQITKPYFFPYYVYDSF